MKTQRNSFIVCGLFLLSGLFRLSAQDKLPQVFSAYTQDKVALALREQARNASSSLQLKAGETSRFLEGREALLEKIITNAKVRFYKDVDLRLSVTDTIDMGTFRIENIRFQSRPGVFVTANLYVPNGEGPFPAVITMHGHWPNGRRTEIAQTTSQLLAMNGYVCLAVDAWGAGERGAKDLEYHGANLGASLLDVGETLLGMQLTDNMRGVDLLCSLDYVDKNNIGATGASGGGNQTMWLSAVDTRIKASVPVVSVGSFYSYILNSNCVCELLPNGLTFTEEDGILGLIAPRPLKILTAMNDANPSFSYTQMQSTYTRAKEIYKAVGKPNNIDYELFNTGHGYWPDMQITMLSWFDIHLKTHCRFPQAELDEVRLQDVNRLATYRDKAKEPELVTTAIYCSQQAEAFRNKMLMQKETNVPLMRKELADLLSVHSFKDYKMLHQAVVSEGWDQIIIETNEDRLIPFLHKFPAQGKPYTIIAYPTGKDSIPRQLIEEKIAAGEGVVLVDLWGTGESRSEEATKVDGSLPPFHTLARSALWLGETVMGKWVGELEAVVNVVAETYNADRITLVGVKETAIATLLFAALDTRSFDVELQQLPVSYQFDNQEQINAFNMAAHIPGFLQWGDISRVAALTQSRITCEQPVTMSGRTPSKEEQKRIEKEFLLLRKQTGQQTEFKFKWNK